MYEMERVVIERIDQSTIGGGESVFIVFRAAEFRIMPHHVPAPASEPRIRQKPLLAVVPSQTYLKVYEWS
jgi:hypothetical protein